MVGTALSRLTKVCRVFKACRAAVCVCDLGRVAVWLASCQDVCRGQCHGAGAGRLAALRSVKAFSVWMSLCFRAACQAHPNEAGLSTSSGLVDSLTWLLQIKQACTRDAYDSTLKALLNPPQPPRSLPLLFSVPFSQAPQAALIGQSASGLFQLSQIRNGGDFQRTYSTSSTWALISSVLYCTVTWFYV